MDAGALAQATDALKAANVPYKSATIEKTAALIRFPTVTDQLRGNTVLEKAMPNNVVALTLSSRTPEWLRVIGLKPMALGLDLRGGVHFLYQVDLNAAIRQYLTTYESDVRTQLREAKIRNDTRVVGDMLQVAILEPGDVAKAEPIIRKLDSNDQLIQLGKTAQRLIIDQADVDGRPGFRIRLSEAAIRERQDFAIQQNTLTLRNRVNELGVAEPIIQRQGSDRVVVELPGVQDTAQAKRILGATATLEYRAAVGATSNEAISAAVEALRSNSVPPGARVYYMKQTGPDGKPLPILLSKRVIASGDQLVTAQSSYDSRTGSPSVDVTLNSVGGDRMFDFTSQNVGKPMAVVYIERVPEVRKGPDGKEVRTTRINEQVVSVATVQSTFGKQFQTTGLSSPKESADLALLLRAGALAAPMDFVEERIIGPSLGAENIQRGLEAVGYSFLFALVFFLFYYRMFGVITCLALLLNLLAVIAILSVMGATMTLPGLAGIALTVGMSVDANVLINERIREDLRQGMPPLTAIAEGYKRAKGTIYDANMTTILAGVALFAFGTGPIKGFAVTLIVGILTSMYTAVSVSRGIATMIYGRRRKLQSIAI
jgi:preprotein translocase subunit SecD